MQSPQRQPHTLSGRQDSTAVEDRAGPSQQQEHSAENGPSPSASRQPGKRLTDAQVCNVLLKGVGYGSDWSLLLPVSTNEQKDIHRAMNHAMLACELAPGPHCNASPVLSFSQLKQVGCTVSRAGAHGCGKCKNVPKNMCFCFTYDLFWGADLKHSEIVPHIANASLEESQCGRIVIFTMQGLAMDLCDCAHFSRLR